MAASLSARRRHSGYLEPEGVMYAFSDTAAEEVRRYARMAAATPAAHLEDIEIDWRGVPRFADEVRTSAAKLSAKRPFLVYEKVLDSNSLYEHGLLTWLIANVLGEPVVQNDLGEKVVGVYNRESKTIEEGARFHRTKQGEHVHNDCISDPNPFDFLVFSCAMPAILGGESILIDAASATKILSGIPEAKAVLEEEFWFENRGMANEDRLFQMPILSYDEEQNPQFRYFRQYIGSAHKKARQELTERQNWALDVLDATLSLSNVQHRIMLREGQTLVALDKYMLHSRTSFVDKSDPQTIDIRRNRTDEINRYFFRVWVEKSSSRSERAPRHAKG